MQTAMETNLLDYRCGYISFTCFDLACKMEDDYLLQPPNTQKFYKWLSYFMTYTAMGDSRWWNIPDIKPAIMRKLVIWHGYLMYIGPISTLISQLVYIYKHFHELTFSIVGIMITILPVNFYLCGIVLIARLKRYQNIVKAFLFETHLINYDDGSQTTRKIIIKAQKLTRYTAYYFMVTTMVDSVCWCTFTGFLNIGTMAAVKNHTAQLHTVLYLMLPYDFEHEFKYWIFTHILSSYTLIVSCVAIVIFHTLNTTIILNFIGHIEILKQKIKSVVFTESSEEEIKIQLIEVIKYHTFLVRTYEDIESSLGLGIALIYLYNLIADSLSLVQIMIGERNSVIIYILMIAVYVGSLIIISLSLEQIPRETSDLSDMIYEWPWESMSLPNQRMVIMILARMQPPLFVKATGGIITGVKPAYSILKTTFSIYVMLKASLE